MSSSNNPLLDWKSKLGLSHLKPQLLLALRFILLGQLLLLLVLGLRLVYFHLGSQASIDESVASQLTPWFQRHAQPNKGLELPILFCSLSLLCCALWFSARFLTRWPSQAFARLSSLVAINLILCLFWNLVFFPSADESIASFLSWKLQPAWHLSLVVFFCLWIRIFARWKFQLLAYAAILLSTMISLSPLSLYNYSYILEPALRLIEGEPIKSVTSQYDLLLPLTTMPFLIGKWDLNSYKILLQLASAAFYLWMFYELAKLVRREILLVSAVLFVLAKVGFSANDPSVLPQISFLRLELWFPLFILVLRCGLYSRATVTYLMVIVLLSKTFASIYAGMYLLYLALLFLSRPNRESLFTFLSATLPIVLAIGLSQWILPNQRLSEYLVYQISFLPMASFSFFWLVAPLLLLCAAILFFDPNGNEKRDHASSLLVFLSCGALVYFLGRSHEQNLLNVASPLIFCFALSAERVRQRLPLVGFVLLCASGLMVNDVRKSLEPRLESLKVNGLSPKSLPAAGDFSQLNQAHQVPNANDGKTIYCFPYSSLEFYFQYHQYGNYRSLPLSNMRLCGTILKQQDLTEYEDKLKSYGFRLQMINSGEF